LNTGKKFTATTDRLKAEGPFLCINRHHRSLLADQQNKSSGSYQQSNQNTDDQRNNQCGRAVGFDPAPFCAAPMPNQKRSSSMGVSAIINAALWRPYYAYDYGELP
jgi:hypothetical protein